MRSMSLFLPRSIVMIAAGWLLQAASAVDAADYIITASGPFSSAFSDSSTFDGTTSGTLPSILDIDRLPGGSFQATYRFTAPAPAAGQVVTYSLSASSGMISFDLLDSQGQVVHHGSNPSAATAYVQNNVGAAPFTVDQVLLDSSVGSISGSHFPAAIYSPPGDRIALADLNFAGTLGPGVDYITSLSIPTTAATYLAFSDRIFDVLAELGDGDYINRVNPYQLVDTQATYDITSVTVTPVVPEPVNGLLAIVAIGSFRRSRSRCAGHRA